MPCHSTIRDPAATLSDFMRRVHLPRAALAAITAALLLGVACGGIEGAVCGLAGYSTDIQDELDTLLALDPALVAQAGTPENAAALAALDSLDATEAAAQANLDSATDDEVGPVVRAGFQAILDATESASTDLRAAIDAGDAGAVASAMDQVQLASDAIDAFQELVEGLRIECPGASVSPSQAPSASVPPSVAPTPVVTPTVEPTATPAPTPTATPGPTATPAATATAAPPETAAPTPTPPPATPTASPSPTASPTPSESPSASGSGSAEPSPSPSAEPGDEGGGLLPWIIVLGLLGTAAAAIVLWFNQRNQPPPADDLGGPPPPGATPS
jgi:hypothetical protein